MTKNQVITVDQSIDLPEVTINLSDDLYNEASNDNQISGEKLFSELIANCPDYYYFRSEVELIEHHASRIAGLLGRGLHVVEYGPGCEQSIKNKSLRFLSGFKSIESYCAVDVNKNFAESAARFIGANCNVKKSIHSINNCFSANLSWPDANTLLFSFGGLICNQPLAANDNLSKPLSLWRSQLQKGAHLLVSQDANQDIGKLQSAYDNKWMERLVLNSLLGSCSNKIAANNLKYKVVFDNQKQSVILGALFLQNQEIILNNKPRLVESGDFMPVVDSYKLTEEQFLNASQNAGFLPVQTFRLPNNPIVMHLLRAA
jgi:uncharacterized SAM-dependent methyltransferase